MPTNAQLLSITVEFFYVILTNVLEVKQTRKELYFIFCHVLMTECNLT